MKQYATFFNIIKYLLVILFVYTGVSKLIGHMMFYQQLSAIPVFSKLAGFISYAVPTIEIITGFSLIFQKLELSGWWLSATLLTLFTIYLVYMLVFMPQLPCSCSGIIEQLSWKQHLVINIFLAAISWLRIYHYKNLYAYKEVS